MFLFLYRKSIGLLVKLPGTLQRRGDFCLKESIRQPLCLIWLCLKEPDQKGNSHSCPSSCKKSSSIHCHNKRNMTFLLSVFTCFSLFPTEGISFVLGRSDSCALVSTNSFSNRILVQFLSLYTPIH